MASQVRRGNDPGADHPPASSAALGRVRRSLDEVRALLETASADDLAERAAAVREKLAEAGLTLAAAVPGTPHDGDGADRPARDTWVETLADAERQARDRVRRLRAEVRKHPLGAMLTALAGGALLGMLLSRRR